MKLILLLPVLLLTIDANATNYYFSSTSGDDNRSSSQAQNPNTPWRTINKLNSFFNNLRPGDYVFFKRGESFFGSINLIKSGASGSPIIFSAYGSGSKPVITGLSPVSNWGYIGNGIWESYNGELGSIVNMVLLNGAAKEMGRYPNSDATNKGYLSYESHSGNTSITDYQLSGSPNWKGGEVVVRKLNYIIDRHLITGHSGNTINYSQGASPYLPTDNNGYFIQNHINTLDQFGEWYYSPSERKLKMFFGGNSPSSYDIKASAIGNLVNLNSQENIIFDNLAFSGANLDGLNIYNAGSVSVTNCDVSFSGKCGLKVAHSSNIIVDNCRVSYSNSNGIDYEIDDHYGAIRNNIVENTYTFAGMGQSADGNGIGIVGNGRANTIEYNQVLNTGYIGISFSGDDVLVKNNFVNRFDLTKDDGGGIYTYTNPKNPRYTGRKIIGNIVMNGIGSKIGTDLANDPDYLPGMGIYLDDNSSGVEIKDNTVANIPLYGIFFHNAHDNVLQNNTVFNNKIQLTIADYGHDLIRNNYFGNNIFFSKYPEQGVSNLVSLRDEFGLWGLFNGNYYCRPLNDKMPIVSRYIYNNWSRTKVDAFDLDAWMTKFQFDWNSQQSPVQFPGYSINYSDGVNKFPNGTFNTNIGYPSNYSPVNNIRTTWNNGGKLDGGSLQISYPNLIGYGDLALSAFEVGSVHPGKKYLLKFSLVGSLNNKSLGVHIRRTDNQKQLSSTKEYVKITTSRTENEILFSVNSSVSAADLVFEVNDQSGTYWLDNIQLTEVDATPTNPDDYIRFEYNPTNSSTTISLDGDYVDVRNNKYRNSVTLQPYSSVILLRDPAGTTSSGNHSNPSSGNSSDNTPPTIVAKNITIQADGSGRGNISATDVIESISDNSAVDKSSIKVSQTQFNCGTGSSVAVPSGAIHQAFTATTPTGVQNFGGELGMLFNVNNPNGIVISELGAFDHQGNGISGTQSGGVRVAIFDRVTRQIVPGLDAVIVGYADGINGNHRMKRISPVTLRPGRYIVVAKGYNQNELAGNSSLGSSIAFGDIANGAISYDLSQVLYGSPGNNFDYPTNNGYGPGYLAGTFTYSVGGTGGGAGSVSNSPSHQAFTANTTSGVQSFGGSLGMVFKVNNPSGIIVNQLGAFDHHSDGITGTQNGGVRVAIFSRTTKVAVLGLDAFVVGYADGLNGNHRMKNISPVVLPPGEYVVVAMGYNQNELNGNSELGSPIAFGDRANGAISYGTNGFYDNPTNGFAYPTIEDQGLGYLAGTFSYTTGNSGSSTGNNVNTITISANDIYGNTSRATAMVTVVCQGQNQRVAFSENAASTQALVVPDESIFNTKANALTVFPSPSTGRFTLQLSNLKGPRITVEIMSENGTTVSKKTVSSFSFANSVKMDFDLSSQPAGVYFIKAVGTDGVKTGKVVVQR